MRIDIAANPQIGVCMGKIPWHGTCFVFVWTFEKMVAARFRCTPTVASNEEKVSFSILGML